MPFGITALGLIASGALATLGSELARKALYRKGSEQEQTVSGAMVETLIGLLEEGDIDMSGGYDLVGYGSDFGGIGADLLMAGVSDDLLLAGVEDLIGDGEDEALLQALSVSGAGNTELIGAVSAAKKAKAKAALKQIAMRNAGAVMTRGLDRRRRYPLGFVPTVVAAATSSAIPAAPQNLFRPERLVIPSDIAFDTGVRDIKVGNQSQLVQSVEVPGALFSEVAINTGVTFDTAEVGNQVSVDVRNKSALSFEFSAGLVGAIAK
jgi:hypothetical protein